MIGRRAFTLGLASLALPRPARAAFSAKPPHKLKDIPYTPIEQIPNHRQFMRDIVIELASWCKQRDPHFIVLARDAPELLIKEQREWDWESGRDMDGAADGKYSPAGSIIRPYLNAIDGMLIDGLFCGRDSFDQPTDPAETKILLQAAAALHQDGRQVFSIEYGRSHNQLAGLSAKTTRAHVLSIVDEDGRDRFDRVPGGHPAGENAEHITGLAQVHNFLPIFASRRYASRADWVSALAATNYDLLILDPFWRGKEVLTKDDIGTLKYKNLGSRRLVIARLPVGRAFDDRYYWKAEWQIGTPDWLVAADPGTPSAATVVRYWEAEWKSIIGQYMQGLADLGVDGVLFDDIDAYAYFEQRLPLQ